MTVSGQISPIESAIEAALAAYAEGGTLKTAVKGAGLCQADFYGFLRNRPDVKSRYYAIQQDRADMMIDEAYEISTDDEIDPRRARVQAETRIKIAGKFDRARFGEHVDVNHTATIDLGAALAAAKSRVALPQRDLATLPSQQVIDVTPLPAMGATDTQSAGTPAEAGKGGDGGFFD